MKKILIKNLIAISLFATFSSSALASEQLVAEPTPTSTTEKSPSLKELSKSQSPEIKKEESKYKVSKSTLYNQLAYDFSKKGYKTVWKLSFDPSFNHQDFNSIEDEIVFAVNRANQVWNGNFEDGNKVQGLICPQSKEVHFVFSQYAEGVVDANGVSCNLITPKSENTYVTKGSDGSLSSSGVAATDNHGGANYHESGNVLSGPMIVGGKK